MLTRIESRAAARLSPSPNYDTPAGKRSQLIVVHDVEAPLTQAYATSLAGPAYFGKRSVGVSAHYLVGPSYALQMVAEEARAWHCGPAGNILSIGIEQTGYARFSRAQWTTDLGRSQIGVLAALMSDISHRHGGPLSPDRASNDQIRAYARGGHLPGGVMWCTHHQITESLGGTTHTDPDPHYPYDLLQAALDAKSTPAKPAASKDTYTVARGDTLSRIAAAHDTTVAELARLNGIADPDVIEVGQVLRLGSAAPKPAGPKVPPYPLPAGYYYGPLSGPRRCISGRYKDDRPEWIAGLRQWQQRMADRGWRINVTGRYDDRTGGVAAAFKAEKGLESHDRNIGRAVWRAAWAEPIT